MKTNKKINLARLALVCLVPLCLAALVMVPAHFLKGVVLCPIRALTGFYCPGCGNTRAAVALLQGHFLESLSYNYLYPIEFAFLAYVYIFAAARFVQGKSFHFSPRSTVLPIVFLAVLLTWGIVRNFLGV